jgi:large subunit ribosomal protein L24
MSRQIRKGDEVVVIAGNDRGKVGKVVSFPKEGRVLVEGVNVRKKHMKRTQENQKGQIIDIERAINISNVMPAVDGKGVKLRVRQNKEKERELYYLAGEKEVLYRPRKKAKG